MSDDGYRRAALYLHGLCDADRSWFLENLSQASTARLNVLLNELLTLGIPRNAMSPRLFLDLSPSVHQDELDSIYTLDCVSADKIFVLIQEESPILISALVSCHDWSWSRQLKAYFSSMRMELPDCRRLSAHFRMCLLRSVARRLRHLPESVNARALLMKNKRKPAIGFFKRKWVLRG